MDNEPRNREIVSAIDKYITLGFSVCIWPSNIHKKDINDMVLDGISLDNVVDIIRKNTYSGLAAKMKLVEWKKI